MRHILGLVLVLLVAYGTYHRLTTMDCNKGDVLCASEHAQRD